MPCHNNNSNNPPPRTCISSTFQNIYSIECIHIIYNIHTWKRHFATHKPLKCHLQTMTWHSLKLSIYRKLLQIGWNNTENNILLCSVRIHRNTIRRPLTSELKLCIDCYCFIAYANVIVHAMHIITVVLMSRYVTNCSIRKIRVSELNWAILLFIL